MKRIITALLVATVLAAPMLALPTAASAQVSIGISVGFAPPPLPWYPQPICPGIGYIWTPGYWGYGPYGYYWVPGTWVFAPVVGYLWTPGYWGWNGEFYMWYPGYWGPRVGFYGGINYGYGYTGYGYAGGYWYNGAFYYNRVVSNVNVTVVHNTYVQNVTTPVAASRVSYNGGAGGLIARPTPGQQLALRERVPATAVQLQQQRIALDNPEQRFSVNNGRPAIAATTRPGDFTGRSVVRMDPERNAYVYREVAHPTPGQPSFRQERRIEQAPQPVYRNGFADPYRPTVRPQEGGFSNGNRVEPRPTPIGYPGGRQSGWTAPHSSPAPHASHPAPPPHKGGWGRPPRG